MKYSKYKENSLYSIYPENSRRIGGMLQEPLLCESRKELISCLRNSIQLNIGFKSKKKTLEREETIFHPSRSGANFISSLEWSWGRELVVSVWRWNKEILLLKIKSINIFYSGLGKGKCLLGEGKSTLKVCVFWGMEISLFQRQIWL